MNAFGKLTEDQLRAACNAPTARVATLPPGYHYSQFELLNCSKTEIFADVITCGREIVEIRDWTHPDCPGLHFRFGYCSELDVIMVDEACLQKAQTGSAAREAR